MKCEIKFFEKDIVGIHPHDSNLMVIIVRCDALEIKRVLIDQGSFVNILYRMLSRDFT